MGLMCNTADIMKKEILVKGTPLSPRNLERAWSRIIEVAGIPYRNFHVLRHTNATDLLAKGIPIVEVARRLGHSRISHTLELYGHAIPTYDATIARQIEALLASLMPKINNYFQKGQKAKRFSSLCSPLIAPILHPNREHIF